MRTLRLGALIGVAVVTAAFAMSTYSCATPTTITVEVKTRQDLCKDTGGLTETGIAVTTERKVNEPLRSQLTDFQTGCANKATGSIGILVITPSGSKTDPVGIRVVAALNGNSASSCDDSEGKAQKNCIIAKRLARFIDNQDVRVTVVIEPECNGVVCPDDLVCIKGGNCAPVGAIGNSPEETDAAAITDATGVSDTEPEKKDADTPAGDAGPCSRCVIKGKEESRKCDLNNGTCTIDCAAKNANCANSEDICVDDDRLNYVFNCFGKASCQDTKCRGAKTRVQFNCEQSAGDSAHCDGVQCEGVACEVRCDNKLNTCINVKMNAKTNTMLCPNLGSPASPTPTCDNVTCTGEKCTRNCGDAGGPGGCGLTSSCDAGAANVGCKDWQTYDGGPILP